MTKISIENRSYTRDTSTVDPNNEWDRPNTAQDNNILGVQLKTKYPDFETCFDVKRGKDYYLLYAEYSTGDSFGHDDGRVEYVDLYKSVEAAELNKKVLEEHNRLHRNSDDQYSVYLTNEKGAVYKYSVPWAGYFECLSEVYVKKVSVID